MKLSFRQGLISFQQSGAYPDFLTPSDTAGCIDLIVAPTPLVATISHGSANYVVKYVETIFAAFGPITQNVTNYLYIGVDILTGNAYTGVTTIEPTSSAQEPADPIPGQHWFDTAAMVMKVRNVTNAKWISTPRVFVGWVPGGSVANVEGYSAGPSAGIFDGAPFDGGYIIFDALRRPIRNPAGELFTSETPVLVGMSVGTNGTAGVLTTPVSTHIAVRAGETIPAMSLVYIADADDVVKLASSAAGVETLMAPIGLVIRSLGETEAGTLITDGEISYDQWNWTGHIGQALWCDDAGRLTTTRPTAETVYRVGTVKNHNTILLDVSCEAAGGGGGGTGTLTTIVGTAPIRAVPTGENTVTISVDQATSTQPGVMTPSQAALLYSFDSRITTNTSDITSLQVGKANVTHFHSIAEISGLTSTLNGYLPLSGGQLGGPLLLAGAPVSSQQATTKAYVDSAIASITSLITGTQQQLDGKLNIAGGSMTGVLTLAADPISALDAASKGYVDTTVAGSLFDFQADLDGKLNIAGGTMSGFIVLNANPIIPAHAATKAYVDQAVVAANNTAGTGVTITNGVISIGQPVATSSNPVFNNLIVNGNLTVAGTTTTISQSALDVGNASISVLSGQLGIPTQNGSFIVNRGSSPDVAIRWNEANDTWELTADGVSYSAILTGDLLAASTYTDAQAQAVADARIAAITLGDLVDVDTSSSPPTDLQVLSWVAAANQWKPRSVPTSVSSVNGKSGTVTLTSTDIPEGSNQYFTQARARTAISAALPLSYNNITGVLSLNGSLGTVTSVNASGGTTGLSFTGGPITSAGTITLGGTLAVAAGGTGATTAALALKNLLPSQAGHATKALITDGTTATWSTVSADNILPSMTNQAGKVLATDGTNILWSTISPDNVLPSQVNNVGKYLYTNGSTASWITITSASILPSQSSQAGKFLTTNGATASWADVTATMILPTQTGQAGKSLITNGTTAAWGDVTAATTDSLVGGDSGQIAFQSAPSVTSFSPVFTWAASTGTLTLGSVSGVAAMTASGSGNLSLNGVSTIIKSAGTERMRFLNNGSLSFGSSGTGYGTSGQVLTSSGSSGPPTWTSLPTGASAAGAAGAIQVSNGSGTFITGNGVTSSNTTTFTGAASSAALAIRSDGTSSFLDIGRTANDAMVGVASAAGVFFTDSAAGDFIVRGSRSAVRIGIGAGTTAATLVIDSAGNATLGQAGMVALKAGGTEKMRVTATGALSFGTSGTNYGAAGQVLTSTGNDAPQWVEGGDFMLVALGDETSPTTTGTATVTFRAPHAMTLYQRPRISLSNAGSSVTTVDIKVNGVSIFSTVKLSINAGAKTSTTATAVPTMTTTTVADDAEITFDIVAAGTGATGLKLTLYYRR